MAVGTFVDIEGSFCNACKRCDKHEITSVECLKIMTRLITSVL